MPIIPMPDKQSHPKVIPISIEAPLTMTPEPSIKYHLLHGVRDLAVVAGLAALTFAASDDFRAYLEAHPQVATYAVLFQLAARMVLATWGKADAAVKRDQ